MIDLVVSVLEVDHFKWSLCVVACLLLIGVHDQFVLFVQGAH
jgi:hypothetical protein